MSSLYYTRSACVGLCFCSICVDRYIKKGLKLQIQTFAHSEKKPVFFFFFTDAVGLYTVWLPCSINVNQQGFFWERNIWSGYSQGLWGQALCQKHPLIWCNRSGQTLLVVNCSTKKKAWCGVKENAFKSFQ